MSNKEAPADTGATHKPSAADQSVAPESTTSAGDWAFSPIRQAAVAAEQRALAGFEQIADTMPEVAAHLTTRLLPDRTVHPGRWEP